MAKGGVMQVYLVGGAVRDKLLGLPIKDKDFVVVGVCPDDLLAQGFVQVGADFPVFLHPDGHHEYALARTERKNGTGHLGFSVNTKDVSLEDDLLRRDLTINAMAIQVKGLFDDTPTGDVIDPYGGQNDLKNKVLRHVSPAFAEDPLRVLRVARFYARFYELGFGIAPDTVHLMQHIAQTGELSCLSRERIWAESVKALGEPCGFAYFKLLHELGILAHLLPDLNDAWQNEQARQTSLNALARAAAQDTAIGIRFSLLMSAFITDSDGLARLKRTTHTLNTPNTINHAARLLLIHHQDVLDIMAGKTEAHTLLKLIKNNEVPEENDSLQTLWQTVNLAQNSTKEKTHALLKLIENTKAQKDDRQLQTLWQTVNLMHNTTHDYHRLTPFLAAYRMVGITDVPDGLTGKAIGDELTRLRLLALEQCLEEIHDKSNK